MRAATRVNAEQASKREDAEADPIATSGKAATDREASETSTGRFRRGSGGGTHGRGEQQQHGKPCRWRARVNRNPARGRPGRQGGGQARRTEDAG